MVLLFFVNRKLFRGMFTPAFCTQRLSDGYCKQVLGLPLTQKCKFWCTLKIKKLT